MVESAVLLDMTSSVPALSTTQEGCVKFSSIPAPHPPASTVATVPTIHQLQKDTPANVRPGTVVSIAKRTSTTVSLVIRLLFPVRMVVSVEITMEDTSASVRPTSDTQGPAVQCPRIPVGVVPARTEVPVWREG